MEEVRSSQDTFQFREILGPEAQRALERLLNEAFHVAPGHSFFEDFPVWDEAHGCKMLRVGAWSGPRLVASACIRKALLKIEGRNVPVALLGGVATDPAYRGKGLASQAVSLAMKWQEAGDAVAFFLWGSEHSLYARLGFDLYGRQLRAELRSVITPGAAGGALQVQEGWTPALLEKMQRRSSGLSLVDHDRSWIEAHKNVRWFWTGPDNDPSAWAALGRGIDLPGIIHEWGGEKESLTQLIRALARTSPELQIIGSERLFTDYGFSRQDAVSESLCLARPNGEAQRAHLERLTTSAWLWGLDGA